MNGKGGCCSLCKYDKYIGALEFHHINPNGKDVNMKTMSRLFGEKLEEELKKCILVCSNCHREIHGHTR